MEKWPIQFVDLPRLWFSSSQTVSVPEGMSLIQPYGVDPFAPTCSLICCMLYNDFSSILIPQNNIGYDSCFFFFFWGGSACQRTAMGTCDTLFCCGHSAFFCGVYDVPCFFQEKQSLPQKKTRYMQCWYARSIHAPLISEWPPFSMMLQSKTWFNEIHIPIVVWVL